MKSFLAGVGLGFGVGLLLAPEAGSETRKKVLERLSTTTGQIRDSSQPIMNAVGEQLEQLDITKERVLDESASDGVADETTRLLEILNSASKTQLMSVSGIGDATARHIIESRPYDSGDSVVTSGILSEEVMRNMKKEVLDSEEDAA